MPNLSGKNSDPSQWRQRHARYRNKIKSGNIIKKLQQHIAGEIELSATQIQAARILLNRTIPELKMVEIKQEGRKQAIEYSSRELLDVIDAQFTEVRKPKPSEPAVPVPPRLPVGLRGK